MTADDTEEFGPGVKLAWLVLALPIIVFIGPIVLGENFYGWLRRLRARLAAPAPPTPSWPDPAAATDDLFDPFLDPAAETAAAARAPSRDGNERWSALDERR
jgi:hypothetical protein